MSRRTPGFRNLDIFWRTYISVRTQTFSLDSTHSFINEAPGEVLDYVDTQEFKKSAHFPYTSY